jgi:hypothetical protein
MKWISIKDKSPEKYEYYLVLARTECISCDKGESHTHKMNYKQYRYDVARWSQKDMTVVNWYKAKGDNSWDHCASDRFTECSLMDNEITHWMIFPNYTDIE